MEVLAQKFGTPLYVYSATHIEARFKAFNAAFRDVPHTICYSVKANSNLSILKMLDRLKKYLEAEMGTAVDIEALTRE